jgi:DHA1 family multidrug resistance protein-like MFS transporter
VPPAPKTGDEHGLAALKTSAVTSFSVVFEVPGLLALIATLFLVQAGVSAVAPILALFVDGLLGAGSSAAAGGASADSVTSVASVAGLILGSTAITSAVAAGMAGKISGRIGHERMIAICAIAGGLLYFPQALVVTAWQLLVLRAILGVFDGGLMPSVMATIALRSPASQRGWVFGLTATATSLGNAVGPAAGAAAASLIGLRASFVFTGAVLVVAGVWVAVAMRHARRSAGARLAVSPSAPAVPQPAVSSGTSGRRAAG